MPDLTANEPSANVGTTTAQRSNVTGSNSLTGTVGGRHEAQTLAMIVTGQLDIKRSKC
jgi:hypothetical protein